MENITLNGVEYTPVVKQENKRLTQTFDFEIYPIDIWERTFDEALQACKALGAGWRLPTRVELMMIYENRKMIGGLPASFYWSSTENIYYNAWLQNFNNGLQSFSFKNSKCNVRAVRTIENDK